MDRITAIQKSLTVFVCGILGFVPVLGLVPAVHALACWRAVHARYGRQWNPASAYLTAGLVFAWIGLVNSVVLLTVAALVAISQWCD